MADKSEDTKPTTGKIAQGKAGRIAKGTTGRVTKRVGLPYETGEPTPTPAEMRQANRDKYRAAVEQVWVQPHNCPVCDSTAWAVGDVVESPIRNLVPNPEMWVGEVYTFVPVTCLFCGYTHFFHSGVLDVRLTEEVKGVPPLRSPGEVK